jgi:DNA-binding Lrp family transcriptional regulator
MIEIAVRYSGVTDDLDRQIIYALQLSPRAPFARIAEVLTVSEQTVARRYRRLRGDGILRIVGLVDPHSLGQSDWLVRVGCRPGGATRLADALARRPDVSWVTVGAGGSEILCSVRSHSTRQRDDLLQRLPNTSQVLTLAAHEVMHRFVGSGAADWTGYDPRLSAAQVSALLPPAGPAAPAIPAAPSGPREPIQPTEPAGTRGATLQDGDGPLLEVLARDGRASYAVLAAATGWSQGVVARRVDALSAAGVLYFDIDLATQLMGFTAEANLWLTVEPSQLASAGELIASHPEVPFASAITGTANLVAAVVCRDTGALYRYVTTRIGPIAGVRQLEISPMLRRVKRAGTLVDGQRLAVLPPP